MSPFLLGVSLSSWSQVLGRTFALAYGEASGFFYVQTLPRAQDRNPRGHPMLLSIYSARPSILSSVNEAFRFIRSSFVCLFTCYPFNICNRRNNYAVHNLSEMPQFI